MVRRIFSAELHPLREAPDAGISAPGTPESRLGLVEILTTEAWTLAGRAVPTLARAELPIRIRPLRARTPVARERASDA